MKRYGVRGVGFKGRTYNARRPDRPPEHTCLSPPTVVSGG